MANGFKELKLYVEKLHELNKAIRDEVAVEVLNQTSLLFLRKVKQLTPVGQKLKREVRYGDRTVVLRNNSEKMRQSWQILSDKLMREGNTLKIPVINSASYASYVNDGHRQEKGRYVPILGRRLVANWVEGLHMVEDAHAYANKNATKIAERVIRKAFAKKGLL